MSCSGLRSPLSVILMHTHAVFSGSNFQNDFKSFLQHTPKNEQSIVFIRMIKYPCRFTDQNKSVHANILSNVCVYVCVYNWEKCIHRWFFFNTKKNCLVHLHTRIVCTHGWENKIKCCFKCHYFIYVQFFESPFGPFCPSSLKYHSILSHQKKKRNEMRKKTHLFAFFSSQEKYSSSFLGSDQYWMIQTLLWKKKNPSITWLSKQPSFPTPKIKRACAYIYSSVIDLWSGFIAVPSRSEVQCLGLR